MNSVKRYIVQDLMSFGVLALVFCVISLAGMTEVNADVLLLLFLMTSCIAFVMFFIDKLSYRNTAAVFAVHLAVICAIVFGIGIPIGFIPPEATYIWIVLGIIAVVYFSVYLIMFLQTKSDADKINKQLEFLKVRRKKEQD